MTLALLIVLGALALFATAGLVAVTVHSRISPGPTMTGRTVVIHLDEDQSLRGVIVATHSDRWTLREVVYLHRSGEQPAGGMAHVPVSRILWVQEV